MKEKPLESTLSLEALNYPAGRSEDVPHRHFPRIAPRIGPRVVRNGVDFGVTVRTH